MGFGGLKSIAKAVVKPKTWTDPKSLAGVIASPFTGGVSLALTANELMNAGNQLAASEKQKEEAKQKAIVEERELEERRKNKMASLAERGQKQSGLSALIGAGGDSLG